MLTDFKPLIRNSNFRYLWASQVLSQLTIHIMNFLLLVRLFNETGSTIATSFLWVAYALPALLIGPFAAASVDMFDRRKILMLTNLLQAVTIFFFAYFQQTSLFILYIVAAGYSFLNQFYVPAEFATLPGLVRKKNLAHANGLFFLTQTSAMIFGFGVAGILSFLFGFSSTLYLCSSFIFMAFISVSFLPEMPVKEAIPKNFKHAFMKFFERIMEGYKFIKKQKSILFPFVLLMVLQIAIAVVVVNVPVLATDILQVPVESSGLAIVVPVGIGTALGAIFFPKILRRGWRKKKAIEWSLMLLTLSVFLLAFWIPKISTINRIFVGVFVIVITGFSFSGVIIPAQTFLQQVTPGGLRGRVFGNYWFLVTVATIFPVIFGGVIAEIFGVRLLYMILGVVALSLFILSKRYAQRVIAESF